MEKATIEFSIPQSSQNVVMDIGSVGETAWSLSKSSNYGRLWVDVFRSHWNGEVKIDFVGAIRGNLLIREFGIRIVDGQKTIRLNSGSHFEDGVFKGFLIVYGNSNCTLASDETTHSSIASSSLIKEGISLPSPQLANDLLDLWDNPDSFSDATLVCGPTKFPVHKIILSARSHVFAAMFKTQMQEGRDGVVDIVDMEPDVLQAMLRYVYSGKTDHLTHLLAEDLLFGADKYQLKELKLVCVELLKVSMAENNVFSYLVLGDLHDESLKVHAVEFICKYNNFSALEKTEDWLSLMKERPSLAIEVTTSVLKYLEKIVVALKDK